MKNSIEEHSIFRVNMLKNFPTKEDSTLKLNFKKMYIILFFESTLISKQLIFVLLLWKFFFCSNTIPVKLVVRLMNPSVDYNSYSLKVDDFYFFT